jgi:hypothetical protein
MELLTTIIKAVTSFIFSIFMLWMFGAFFYWVFKFLTVPFTLRKKDPVVANGPVSQETPHIIEEPEVDYSKVMNHLATASSALSYTKRKSGTEKALAELAKIEMQNPHARGEVDNLREKILDKVHADEIDYHNEMIGKHLFMEDYTKAIKAMHELRFHLRNDKAEVARIDKMIEIVELKKEIPNSSDKVDFTPFGTGNRKIDL